MTPAEKDFMCDYHTIIEKRRKDMEEMIAKNNQR